MKRTARILAILVTGFIAGCQDSSITDPTAPAVSDGPHLSKNLLVHSIDLSGIVRDGLDAYAEITGTVYFQTTLYQLDPPPPNPQFAVGVHMKTSAEVRPDYHNLPPIPSDPMWPAGGVSDDFVTIPASGVTFLTKSYELEGRSDGTLLNLQFRITLNSVEVSRMWLGTLQLPPVHLPDFE